MSKDINTEVAQDPEVFANDADIGNEALLPEAGPHSNAESAGQSPAATDLVGVAAAIDELRASVDRFSESSQAQEALVQKMQDRITELQGDQVRALLGPLFQELASLHADLLEAAAKDYSLLPPERLPKELSFLVCRVETALQLVGLESVGAAPGAEFDSRIHSAARRVATADPSLDRHIEKVQRQGFIFPGAPKASIYARVTVYSFDPALATDPEASAHTPDRAARLDTES